MSPNRKNTVPTRFSIDLATIDTKAEKLAKYINNCFIDLKELNLRFINSDISYTSLMPVFKNKKYKESLSKLIDKIYFDRFVQTRQKLINEGMLTGMEFMLPGAYDDFGSKFDAFAATNTDPNNIILQIFGVVPYKELIVDIFSEEDYALYQQNLSANYDVERLKFILQNLENLTLAYIDPLNTSSITGRFIDDISEKILNFKPSAPPAPGENTQSNQFNLLQVVPNIQNAIDIFSLLRTPGINSQQFSNTLFFNTLQIVEQNLRTLEDINKISDFHVLEKSKIKVLSFIIKNEILAVLENKIALAANLNNYQSKYSYYNFYEQKFEDAEEKTPQNKLIFRLTFLKKSLDIIQQTNKQYLLDNTIEFNNITNINIDLFNPLGSSKIKDDRFVAFVTSADLKTAPTPVEFFEPTVLSILSDINYIDHNIYEINPAYCPPQELLSSHAESNKDLYVDNDTVIDSIAGVEGRYKELVKSNDKAFNFYNFPDFYFIPNVLKGPGAFYLTFEEKLTREQANKLIEQNTIYFYRNPNDAPANIISRDQNLVRLFDNARLNNGFYGFFPVKKDSFSDPFSIQKMKERLDNLTGKFTSEVQSIVLAKTNIACLLSEFQECFLPKIGSCKDVLRGFRFSELENLVTQVFPETIYASLYEIINTFKQNSIRDAKEKELLDEIERLERAINNNPRKIFVFEKLDRKIKPAEAFGLANIEIGNPVDISLEEQYKAKLQEYKDFILNKEILPESAEQEQLKIDEFLDLLEKNGIDIEILCDLAKIIGDLTKISFTFGNLTLPQLPSINLFQEVKLSIDLSIIEIILQTVIAFIKKILEELLTCGGIKDLIEGALTGQAEGLTGGVAALVNQVANNKFDLEEFVKNNPQVDPSIYNQSINNLANSLANSIAITSSYGASANVNFGYLGEVNALSKTTTRQVLSNPSSSATTEKEIVVAINGLISELVVILTPEEFVDLMGGKPLNTTLLKVVGHIISNRRDIAYLGDVTVINKLFTTISQISGLDQVRNDLRNVASTYSANGGVLIDKFCIDQNITTFQNITSTPASPSANNNLPPNVQQLFADRQKFRDLINDLLSCSPEKVKLLIDDKVFKPILMGILPNGKPVTLLNESNKKRINSSLKKINNKIKSSSNSFYSSLTLKKPYLKEIKKMIPGEGNEGGEYENPEFKDEINKGGNKVDNNGQPDTGDTIYREKEKLIYCGVFTENIISSSQTFNIRNDDSAFILSLEGKQGIPSGRMENYFTTGFSKWKIENIISENENKFNIYEGRTDIPKYSYITNRNSNLDINGIDQLIKDELKKISSNTLNNELIGQHLKNVKQNYFNSLYNTITQLVINDGLLKDVDDIGPEEIERSILNAVSDILDVNMLFSLESAIGLDKQTKDKVLKYINFVPKPTDEQKQKNIDPSLYGKLEITNLISQILSKRKTDIIDLKSLEEILEDKDNTFYLSMIDGFFISLVRTICIEACLRNLFVFRAFNFNKDYLNTLLLQTNLSEILYNEIDSFSRQVYRISFMNYAHEHIEYLHNFIIQDSLTIGDKNLLSETSQLRREIDSLNKDIDILLSYRNRITPTSVRNLNSSNSIEDFNNSVDEYKKCLKDEIKNKQIKLTKLYLRNLIHHEIIIMLDKLTYITSTNNKVLSELGESCATTEQSTENIIIDLLFKEIFDIPWIVDWEFTNGYVSSGFNLEEVMTIQNKKINKRVFVEHFVQIPLIKQIDEYSDIRQRQKDLKLYGICSLKQFQNLISHPLIVERYNQNIKDIFDGNIQYGARVVYLPNIEFNKNKSVVDFKYNEEKTLKPYNLEKFFLENIKEHNAKDIIYQKNTTNTTIEYSQISKIKNKIIDGDEELINIYEKTYFIPWMDKMYETVLNVERNVYMGFTECYPLITESILVPQELKSISDFYSYIETLKNPSTNQLIGSLKQKIKCSEDFNNLNKLFTLDQSMFNMLSFSSLEILSNKQISGNFINNRFNILCDILIKINSIYKDDFGEDFYEVLSSLDFFKNFNAEEILKAAIKAAVHVLAYYCQMTDPNISTSMILRNAVKIAFGLSSGVASMVGGSIPADPPMPLNMLFPYSILQRPVNIFGVPPVGIGTGPPITIPGIVLLGAEALLLSLEFAENIEKNSDNENIKNQLKKLCFDLSGYKKYGVE